MTCSFFNEQVVHLWFTQVANPSLVQKNKTTQSEVVKFFKAHCFWLMFLSEIDVMVAERRWSRSWSPWLTRKSERELGLLSLKKRWLGRDLPRRLFKRQFDSFRRLLVGWRETTNVKMNRRFLHVGIESDVIELYNVCPGQLWISVRGTFQHPAGESSDSLVWIQCCFCLVQEVWLETCGPFQPK